MHDHDPDTLLVEINQSILAKAFLWAVAIHLALAVITSIPLFRDWITYGMAMPSTLKVLRQQSAEARPADGVGDASVAADTVAARPEPPVEAQEKAAGEEAPAGMDNADTGRVTVPEIEPLPPKRGFSLRDDLSLE